MEMVSASKMKKAQDQALASRPFTEKLREMIGHVVSGTTTAGHPLTRNANTIKSIAIIMVSTNKGLCGALNVNLHKGLIEFTKSLPIGIKLDIIAVGKKARTSIPGRESSLIASFNEIGETATFLETRAISSYVLKAFIENKYDQIFIGYPKFISTLKNDVTIEALLPIQVETNNVAPADYQIEPNPTEMIESLLPYEVELTVFQTVLEARASEHSARMVAMKNASDNARDLIGNLTLVYNQARQSQVTSELLDVTTARMTLE